jgi:hypothetical protein
MYVAPLNLDMFFKKVFSNKRIARKFLENLLDVKIYDLKFLSVENKITDASVTVKFDFRCKINGQYVVIEMQQKYKIDVIKRFYLYQAVGTALQLETLKPVEITKPNGEIYTERNYSGLEPVISIIWMVDDMLGFKDDFVAFTTLPEAAKDFITDEDLWNQPLENILAKRKETIEILENKTKGLDFFTQNRMIYVFQKNIVNNGRVDLSYYKWFDVANISRDKNNKEEDFLKYKDDKDMAEVINRIRKDKLAPDEFKYVSDLLSYDIFLARKDEDFKIFVAKKDEDFKIFVAKKDEDFKLELARKLASQKKRSEQAQSRAVEQEKIKAEQEKIKAEQEKIKAEQEKMKADLFQNRLLKSIKILLLQGETVSSIAQSLDISLEETAALVALIQK